MSSMERPELFTLRDHLDSLSGFWCGPEFPFVLVLFFALLWVFVCIRHVSRVPNVASVSGLSILDYPSVFFNAYFNKCEGCCHLLLLKFVLHVLVNLNHFRCIIYSILFVSDLRQVSGFLRVLWFPPPIQLTARYN